MDQNRKGMETIRLRAAIGCMQKEVNFLQRGISVEIVINTQDLTHGHILSATFQII